MKHSGAYWLNLIRFALSIVLLPGLAVVLWLSYTDAMHLVHPVRNKAMHTPADMGVNNWQEVEFNSADGLKLRGWFIPPNPSGPRATLIFVHGFGGNRSDLLDQAARVYASGYGALLFDLRNHGESAGTLTTMGYSEVEDVRGAVQFLLARSEVNPERIGLVGHSMGAGTVIRAAARIPLIYAVVAESSFTTLEDNIAEGVQGLTGLPSFPFAPLLIAFSERETRISLRAVRPIDDVGLIAPRPILFIHGQQDTLIPMQNSIRLYAAALEPRRLYLVPNAGHADIYSANPEEFERQLLEFLNTYVTPVTHD